MRDTRGWVDLHHSHEIIDDLLRTADHRLMPFQLPLMMRMVSKSKAESGLVLEHGRGCFRIDSSAVHDFRLISENRSSLECCCGEIYLVSCLLAAMSFAGNRPLAKNIRSPRRRLNGSYHG